MISQGNQKENPECETLCSTNDIVFSTKQWVGDRPWGQGARLEEMGKKTALFIKKRLKRPNKQKQYVDFV